jgi:hypothetical protein
LLPRTNPNPLAVNCFPEIINEVCVGRLLLQRRERKKGRKEYGKNSWVGIKVSQQNVEHARVQFIENNFPFLRFHHSN